jgi:hypothetical protein
MYISWPVIIIVIIVVIAAVSLCMHFACRSKRLGNVVSKLEGDHEKNEDPDDSDWGDGEGMS